MSVFDNELILPGTITELMSDFSYGYDETLFGTTDSVTIIGTAFNGPTGKPVAIYSPEHAAYVFGEAYDYKTRREATLTANIKDAWDRGCRTIYGIRISGKDIYKDFGIIPETKLKLRVSGFFPSNENKDVYMVYDNTLGDEKIKIYKPAKRATIQEKREGLVDNQNSILVSTINLAGSYGLTRDSRLAELIKVVNEYYRNNVIKLSIVDENGADVTLASKEAQALSVGALFPGVYFIGRNAAACSVQTTLEYKLTDEVNKPYEGFDGIAYRQLKLNTDINSELPIYGQTVTALNELFDGKVNMSKMWDFLEVPGKADEVFLKDKVDYEEVDLDEFEIYKRLGSGYATTAKAEVVVKDGKAKVKRVVETPVSDPNRITYIEDGIYSMLESLKSDYRVLANGHCDTKIEGRLPKKEEFQIKVPVASNIKDIIFVEPIVDKKDKTDVRKYKFSIKKDEELVKASEVKASLHNKTAKQATVFETEAEALAAKLPEGEIVIITESTKEAIGRITSGKFQAYTSSNSSMVGDLFFCKDKVYIVEKDVAQTKMITKEAVVADLGNKDFFLVEANGSVFVYKANAGTFKSTIETVEPVGAIEEVLSEETDRTLITVQTSFNAENVITIRSSEFDYITVEEFIDNLNENKNLNKLFSFSLLGSASEHKDSVVEDAFGFVNEEGTDTDAEVEATLEKDKEDGIDTNLYIPYKTTDNFARHLAQHCKYTSLKTAPTHGILGCSKLLDVNYTSIAKKVDSLLALDLKLYAKKDNGVDILDKNNMPLPIGNLVSVVFGQYTVTTLDGYTHISNGAAGYAGMVSILPIDQSSTNQPIDLTSLMFEFTNYQLEKLTQRGFVTFKQSYTKGIVVTDGVTQGTAASPFRRLSTARINNTVEELIREATEPFIGKQNHLANRNSMQTAIKSKLDSIKDRLIKAYEFRLINDSAQEELGIVDIEYRIIPVYEIREVRNRVTVTNKI